MVAKNATLEWVAVTQPNAMSGKYQVDFYLDEENTEKLVSEIDSVWAEHKGKFKGQPQTLSYKEMDDGRVRFKASQKPENGGYTFYIKVFDASAKEITDVPSIGNGTKANVQFEMYPYHNPSSNTKGVILTLQAIQILDVVEYKAGNVKFEAEEGYTADSENEFENVAAPKGL